MDACVDFLCSSCRMFEGRARPTLERLLLEGAITIVYRPLGLLDRVSDEPLLVACLGGSGVGRRVRGVQGCAVRQPAVGGRRGPRRQRARRARPQRGIDKPEFATFADAVFSGTYLPWTSYVTELAIEPGVGGTPTVVVAGMAVPANPTTIEAAASDPWSRRRYGAPLRRGSGQRMGHTVTRAQREGTGPGGPCGGLRLARGGEPRAGCGRSGGWRS